MTGLGPESGDSMTTQRVSGDRVRNTNVQYVELPRSQQQRGVGPAFANRSQRERNRVASATDIVFSSLRDEEGLNNRELLDSFCQPKST